GQWAEGQYQNRQKGREERTGRTAESAAHRLTSSSKLIGDREPRSVTLLTRPLHDAPAWARNADRRRQRVQAAARAPSAERRAPSAERRPPTAERRAPRRAAASCGRPANTVEEGAAPQNSNDRVIAGRPDRNRAFQGDEWRRIQNEAGKFRV